MLNISYQLNTDNSITNKLHGASIFGDSTHYTTKSYYNNIIGFADDLVKYIRNGYTSFLYTGDTIINTQNIPILYADTEWNYFCNALKCEDPLHPLLSTDFELCKATAKPSLA